MLDFTVRLRNSTIKLKANKSDDAVNQAMADAGVGFDDFIKVTQDNPTPHVDGRYGAPMGRASDSMDPDGVFSGSAVRLDSGGYDKGGAYWGLRKSGEKLYAIQDGMGNLGFYDAKNRTEAIAKAKTNDV